MGRFILILVVLMLLSGCVMVPSEGAFQVASEDLIPDREVPLENPQMGLNFVKADPADTRVASELTDVSFLVEEFKNLGAQLTRQVSGASIRWQDLLDDNGEYHFEDADRYVNAIPMVGDCYSIQYASATPLWSDEWMDVDNIYNEEYLELITERYGDKIKYWEPGNEMVHWSFSKNSVSGEVESELVEHARELPDAIPPGDGEFTVEMKAEFYEYFARKIRENDDDAMILYPGMAGMVGESLLELISILDLVDEDTFDIYNVHAYVPWDEIEEKFEGFYSVLENHDKAGKSIWVTENGVTSSSTLNIRTDYPNSREQQAADVFRRASIFYGLGVEYVAWHTHVSSVHENALSGDWRGYGLRTNKGEMKESWYTYKLFTHELIPFDNVVKLDDYVYEYDTFEGKKYVLWVKDERDYVFNVDADKVRIINVVPEIREDDAYFTVEDREVVDGKVVLKLTDVPVLIKPL